MANIVLGALLLRQSSAMVNTLIRKSMLNVSNTAADLIDGDALGSFTEDDVGSPAWNEIRALGRRIHTMHQEMEQYLDYVHAQVYTDTLTRVGNTTGYLERQKELDAKILDGSADFFTVMFDLDDLKRINDRYGHASGDRTIRAAAAAIAGSFETKNTFRDVFVRADMQMYEQKDRYHRRDRERQER